MTSLPPEVLTFLNWFLLTFVVALVTQIIKVWKDYDPTSDMDKIKLRAIVFAFGVIIALVQYGWQFVPVEWGVTIVGVLVAATGWYKIFIEPFEGKKESGTIEQLKARPE